MSRTSRLKGKHIEEESSLSKEWPPAWSVSFSDITTLLMSCFLLWYSLTAMKIPTELLSFQGFKNFSVEDLGKLKEVNLHQTIVPKQLLAGLKDMSPKQKEAVQAAKHIKELSAALQEYVKEVGLSDAIDLSLGLETILLTMRNPILFEKGKAVLKRDTDPLLERLAKFMEEYQCDVVIEGHTDATPIHPYSRIHFASNWELSSARATQVAQKLIAYGLSPQRVGVSGYSDIKPVDDNQTMEGRQANRRVEIYIYPPAEGEGPGMHAGPSAIEELPLKGTVE